MRIFITMNNIYYYEQLLKTNEQLLSGILYIGLLLDRSATSVEILHTVGLKLFKLFE